MSEQWPEDLVYHYDPTLVEPRFKEGVTDMWLYIWSGEPGPAKAMKMAVLADGEGGVSIVPNGEWQDITVVDNQP
jgi:hypothetical protein